MKTLLIVQAVISLMLVAAILLQSKGEGLGVVGGSMGGSYHTKRGFEKFLMQTTVVLSVAFIAMAMIAVHFSA